MKRYRQTDFRWSRDKLGKTNLNIGRWGCTFTSICNLWTRFHKGHFLPSEASKTFNFTRDGLLIWSTDFPGMKFEGRKYKISPSKSVLKEWITKEKGIIIEVNGTHWVTGYYYGFLGTYIIDPLDGKVKRLYKHYRPTGYALFSKVLDEKGL